MGFIDADAHVIETAQTWNFMLEEERRFAPELLVSARNGVEFWRIEEIHCLRYGGFAPPS